MSTSLRSQSRLISFNMHIYAVHRWKQVRNCLACAAYKVRITGWFGPLLPMQKRARNTWKFCQHECTSWLLSGKSEPQKNNELSMASTKSEACATRCTSEAMQGTSMSCSGERAFFGNSPRPSMPLLTHSTLLFSANRATAFTKDMTMAVHVSGSDNRLKPSTSISRMSISWLGGIRLQGLCKGMFTLFPQCKHGLWAICVLSWAASHTPVKSLQRKAHSCTHQAVLELLVWRNYHDGINISDLFSNITYHHVALEHQVCITDEVLEISTWGTCSISPKQINHMTHTT